jgi:hypothetical protein
MYTLVRLLVAPAAVAVLAIAGALFIGATSGADAHEGGNDFVCPVFKSAAVGLHNPNALPIAGGHSTLLPGKNNDKANHLSVPDHATNADGTGTPPGAHAAPGDPGYSAIWNGD